MKIETPPLCAVGSSTMFLVSGADAAACYLSIIQSPREANFSATLSACAAIVSAGLHAADEGKNELSTT